jgi:hypothetical protein
MVKKCLAFKILPRGSGVLTINNMLGSPPRAVLQGFQALIVSSIEIHCEYTNKYC